MSVTYGDTSSVDCPECGKPIRDLWDYGNDLVSGLEIECPYCEKIVKVKSIATVTEVALSTLNDVSK